MGIVVQFKRPYRVVLASQAVVHLMTQRDQPYGSVRRCCENCGVMILGTNRKAVDNEEQYNDLPAQYRRCIDKVT